MRNRVYIVGMQKAKNNGGLAALQQDITKLSAHFEQMPTHHLDTFVRDDLDAASYDECGGELQDDGQDLGLKEEAQTASEYSEAFAKAVKGALDARRLPPKYERKGLRFSAAQNVACISPWKRSQIDVSLGQQGRFLLRPCVDFISSLQPKPMRYSMIAQFLASSQSEGTVTDHAVADIGQSCNRGAVHLCGSLPSLASSSKIFSFKKKRLRLVF